MATSQSFQEKRFHFLKDSTNYPHKVDKVKIIQTHASILAIASPFVYKVKKPFDFGFMDFRSLESREENFQKEIKLNRRLCKDTYLEILSISESGDKLSFGEEGEIVDYALKMKELKDGFFLHQLLDKGKVNTDTLDQVLQYLKSFYEQQPKDPSILTFGDMAHIKENGDENFSALEQLKEPLIAPEALSALQHLTHHFLEKHQALFRKRVEEGKIKDCHGDLHLEHIHLYQDKICIFDCIEFNDRFRYIDIAADIAFLAMDFDFRGNSEFGRYVAIKLADLMEDPDMLKLMDFYKSYRACVRAKVEGIKSEQEEVEEDEQKNSREKAVRYLQLALRYALTGSSPMVIFLCGRVGTGKSTIARKLAELIGAEYISSDICRKESAGIPLYQEATPEQKRELYSESKKQEVYRLLLEKTLEKLSKHKNVILDATFGKEVYRQDFRKRLQELKIPFYFVETSAPEEAVRERLAKRVHSKEVSDARLENFDMLNRSYEELEEIPEQEYIQLNTEKNVESTIKTLLEALGKKS